jgi:GT2 family glycosyltransferase
MEDYDHSATADVDWLLGAVLMVRRSALEKVGLLDERFFLYFEDTDWCRRFWAAGFRVVYCTEATMVHYHERLSAQGSWFLSPFRRSTRIHISSAVKYFSKWREAGEMQGR